MDPFIFSKIIILDDSIYGVLRIEYDHTKILHHVTTDAETHNYLSGFDRLESKQNYNWSIRDSIFKNHGVSLDLNLFS